MQAEFANDPTDGFFSHEQMRERDPQLWESMIGRFLTIQDRRALLGHAYDSFSGLLLSQLLESESAGQQAATAISEGEVRFVRPRNIFPTLHNSLLSSSQPHPKLRHWAKLMPKLLERVWC